MRKGLLQALRVRCACRYYAKPEHLASIVRKVTWLIVKICRDHINAPGALWDQNRSVLVANLVATVQVHEAFISQYRCGLPVLLTQSLQLSPSRKRL